MDTKKKRHDNRPKNWYVSLSQEEWDKIEQRRAQTGLKKSDYTRQALMTAAIISCLGKEESKALRDLNHMRADINRLVLICEKQGSEKALKWILEIEDRFIDIYNNLYSKL